MIRMLCLVACMCMSSYGQVVIEIFENQSPVSTRTLFSTESGYQVNADVIGNYLTLNAMGPVLNEQWSGTFTLPTTSVGSVYNGTYERRELPFFTFQRGIASLGDIYNQQSGGGVTFQNVKIVDGEVVSGSIDFIQYDHISTVANYSQGHVDFNPTPVPEPATVATATALALVGFGIWRKNSKQRT